MPIGCASALAVRHPLRVGYESSGVVMSPATLRVCQELAAREPIYHHPEFGVTRGDFEAQTDPDFWEVGASGTVYGREDIWPVLEGRYGDPDYHDEWQASNFLCRELGEGYYLMTYLLRQGARLTRRATIWNRAPTGWQVVYHQGTLVESD
jgi:hypothetical protein